MIDAIQTPLGRVILAEAFIQAAGLLVSKHPTAAAAAGASTATAATNLGSTAREAAVDFMQGTASALKSSIGVTEHYKKESKEPDSRSASSGARETGNGGSELWDSLDSDTIRQALLGELSRKKKRKKARLEKGHQADLPG
ncbi:MAG: hypothetical protein M3453_10305 [Pseudomonadota bacterium]|nr:hypothetical protein [Pseudomonadota bacterium]